MSFELSDIPKVVPPPITLDTSGEQPDTPPPVTASPDLTGLPPHDLTRANLLDEARQPPPAQDIIGEHPWDVEDAARDQAKAQWRRDYQATNDRAALEEEKFYKDKDLSFHRDPAKARMLATNDSFLILHNDGLPLPPGELNRKMFRVQKAEELFGGKGAESEEAFHAQIVAGAQGRKVASEFDAAMQREVWKSSVSREVGEQPTDWQTWRTTARTLPGYDPGKEADYLQRWHDYRAEAKERMAPHKEPLTRVWKAMKQGGAGSPSEILKEMLPFASVIGDDLVDELRKEDAGAVAYEIYDQLDEKERADFMDGIHMLVQSFPKDEQPSILSNLAKTGGRSVDDIGHGIFDRFKWSNVVESINEKANQDMVDSAGPWGATEEQKAEARQNLESIRKHRLLRTNFVDKVREMERGEYAPIRHFSDPSKDLFSTRTLEDGVYAIPSVAAYAGTALIPYAGVPAMLAVKEHTAYKNLRDNAIRTGSSELDASLFADKWKTETAIPQTAVEMLQTYIPLGKIPAVNRVLTSAGDRITSRFVRGALTAGAVNVGETVAEEAEHLTAFVVQDLAHAFAADTGISSAEWHNGKDGALDGIWTRAGVNFIAMGPLSAASIPGVLGRDQRMRAFAEATPTQRRAFGLTAEDSAAIDAAALRGPSSLAAAVDTALENRDPNSESAAAAVEELETQHSARQAAVRQAQENGILPRAVQHSDGSFTLYDTLTGEEIATAPDWESATRVATTHANMVEERDSDRIAAVASAYQAAQFSGDWSALTKQQTETRLDLGTSETTTHAAARSEDHRQRVESQELLDGGDGSVTRAVLGESRTTFEEGQARTVNRILDGGSILTIFHEEAHGFRRRAHKNGSLTVADDIAILRAVDTVLAGKTTREGDKQLRLLPENFATLAPKDQETAIDEGISRLMEAEVLRTRKGGGVRELPAGVITKNLSALSRLAGDKSMGKFRAFVRAVRSHFGLAIDRASEIRHGLEDGSINHKEYHGYLSKLHGLDAQQIHDSLTEPLSDSRSFSLSPIGAGARTITEAPPVLPLRENPFRNESAVTPGEWRAVWSSWMKQNRATWEGVQPVVLAEGPVSMGAQTRDHLKQTAAAENPAHHFEAAVRMRELLENSVIATIEPPRAYEKGASEIHRRYAWMEFWDGITRHVLLTVKRLGEETARDVDTLYALEALEVREPDALQVESLPFRKDSPSISSDSVGSIDRFLAGIKPEHRANDASAQTTDAEHPADGSFSLGPAVPRLSEQQSRQVEDLAFENAKRSRIVNTDDIRPLIPGYKDANPQIRDVTYHKTASDITMRVLRKMAAEPPVTGKVLILAGGGGSGKSSVSRHFSDDVDFTFDTTLSNKAAAEALVNGIRASGREPRVLYVHRRFATSFEHIIRRYLDEKSKGINGAPRIIPLPLAYAAHRGAQEVIFSLEGVPVTIIDNNGKLGEFHQIALEQLTQDRYIQTHETSGDRRRIQGMATENSSAGEKIAGGNGSGGTGSDRQDYRGIGTEARVEAEGAGVIREYQRRGRLTSAEVRGFFGSEFFPIRPTIVRTDGRRDRDLHETDPQSILKAIAGIETQVYGRANARTDATKRRKHGTGIASGERVSRWAEENERVLTPDPIISAMEGSPLGGGEHNVVEDLVSNRVVKMTKPGLFGAQGEDAGAYIQRWALHNLAFNSDVTFEGIVTFPGEHAPRAVISQSFVFGRDASPEEQTDFLTERGFHEVESGRWVHAVRGLVLWDTITPGNAIMTDEGVVPIDYQIDHATTEELNRVRQQTGIGGNTSFSISSDPPLPPLNRRNP